MRASWAKIARTPTEILSRNWTHKLTKFVFAKQLEAKRMQPVKSFFAASIFERAKMRISAHLRSLVWKRLRRGVARVKQTAKFPLKDLANGLKYRVRLNAPPRLKVMPRKINWRRHTLNRRLLPSRSRISPPPPSAYPPFGLVTLMLSSLFLCCFSKPGPVSVFVICFRIRCKTIPLYLGRDPSIYNFRPFFVDISRQWASLFRDCRDGLARRRIGADTACFLTKWSKRRQIDVEMRKWRQQSGEVEWRHQLTYSSGQRRG